MKTKALQTVEKIARWLLKRGNNNIKSHLGGMIISLKINEAKMERLEHRLQMEVKKKVEMGTLARDERNQSRAIREAIEKIMEEHK